MLTKKPLGSAKTTRPQFHFAVHSFNDGDGGEREQFSTCVRSFKSEEGLYGKSFFACSLVTTSRSCDRQSTALADVLLSVCFDIGVGVTGHDVCSPSDTPSEILPGLLPVVLLVLLRICVK